MSFLHLLKSILEGNRYFGPSEIIFQILKSGIIFKFPVIILLESLQSRVSGELVSISRSETRVLK